VGLAISAIGPGAQLPDPGAPDFVVIIGALWAFLGSARALVRTRSWSEARDDAFKAGFFGTAIGLLVYGFGLVTGVY
jgi:hypothetical protein